MCAATQRASPKCGPCKLMYTTGYKAVVFDLFGTLCEGFATSEYRLALSQMAAKLGIPDDDFDRSWRGTFNDRVIGRFADIESCLQHICYSFSMAADSTVLRAAARIRYDLMMRALVPRFGAIETLARLRAGGRRIGVLSNASFQVTTAWPQTPFAPFVDVALFSCVCGMKKPDVVIYQLMCSRLGLRPQACIYVGDGTGDELTGAAQAGLMPVLLRAADGHEGFYEAEADGWDGLAIRSLEGVLDLLDP